MRYELNFFWNELIKQLITTTFTRTLFNSIPVSVSYIKKHCHLNINLTYIPWKRLHHAHDKKCHAYALWCKLALSE